MNELSALMRYFLTQYLPLFVIMLILWSLESLDWPAVSHWHINNWQWWVAVAVNGTLANGMIAAYKSWRKENP